MQVDTPGNLTPRNARKHQLLRRRLLSDVDNRIVVLNTSRAAVVPAVAVVAAYVAVVDDAVAAAAFNDVVATASVAVGVSVFLFQRLSQ